ncbi:MAG: glycine zipper 2TM domain-containing protein [Betaproteobacteria bacterium]|nr:glycine zipper 2TM domain-containing protein [Betaproteobacteria bacterium]
MKKPMVVAALVAAAFVGTQLSGCANAPNQGQGSGIGAAAGAVLGGLLCGGKDRLRCALAGAAIGGVIGHVVDRQVATRDEAARKYGYTGRGDVLAMEGARVSPQAVPPGGNVDSSVQYTVLAPNESQPVNVTESYTLEGGGETVPLQTRRLSRPHGTHAAQLKFEVPKDLDRGYYVLRTSVSDGRNTRSAQSQLRVI